MSKLCQIMPNVHQDPPQFKAFPLIMMSDFTVYIHFPPLQVLDRSRQWWMVRNNGREEGYVPQNILEALRKEEIPVRFSAAW